MKKITLLMGVGVGFILGSRAGRGPYETLEAKVRRAAKQDDVQATVNQLRDVASDQLGAAAEKVSEKLPG